MVPRSRMPAKVVGPDQCAKCHQPEVQQWMRTPHFATFDSLHRKPRAKEIADKLGVQVDQAQRHLHAVSLHDAESGRHEIVWWPACRANRATAAR